MKHLAILLIVIGFSQSGLAQKSRFKVFKENSEKRAVIRNSRPLSVFYEKVSWNQSPTEVESGYMYLRDRKTGKLIELNLTETKPDSGVFNVDYPIGVLEQRKIESEVYSAPQSMLKDGDRISLMKDFIKDGSVKRKPFLLRVLRKKGQIVDIFDSKADAIAAYNKYRKEMGLTPEGLESESIIEVANQRRITKKKVIDTSTLQSLFMANENDLDATNEKNKELREVLKNMEIKRRKGVKQQAASWSAVKAKSNINKSNQLIKDALGSLKKQQLKESMNQFFEASNLQPDQEDVYEQYGVSLFRDDKFNQAIVVLELSNPTAKRIPEKNFYIGLSYYNLKDYENAVTYFDKVMESKDKNFAPTAAFYKGTALIELKRFDESQKAFQYVLDNSKNPEMDKRAEKFIEYSLDRKTLEEKRSNWFFLDGVLGLVYDSNIVLADEQLTQNDDITNENGWRFLASVTPKFRPYYSESDEINIALNITALKSYDEGFGSNPTAETADPILLSAAVPWTHRTTLGGKGYFFDLIPSYENIAMDLDGTGMATITNSLKLDFNHTLVINKNWIAKGDWSFASNDANILGDETGADSVSGGLRLSSIFILNKDQERYLIPEFSYRINDAESSIYAFNRVDLGVTFTTSIFEGVMWNNRAAYFLANYESTRVDNNYSITSGISTRINNHWTWGFNAAYIINDSTTNRFNKYTLMNTFSFSY